MLHQRQFEQDLVWHIDLFSEHTQLIFINPPEKIRLPLMNELQNEIIVQRTQTLNRIIRNIVQDKPNVVLLEMDDILGQDDIIDSFSHLKRQGYLKLANALLQAVKIE